MKKSIEDFKGVIPAVLSVFDAQEELDEKGTRELIRFLTSFDIGGLYLTGSTGEAFLMNSEERKRQVEIVMDEVGDRLPVVVHVGAMSTRASVELAHHASGVGVVDRHPCVVVGGAGGWNRAVELLRQPLVVHAERLDVVDDSTRFNELHFVFLPIRKAR